ncbi:MAG: PDDEXK nuclease domain-containing protein [Cyanobacteria bacterium P01_F01_bin.53]
MSKQSPLIPSDAYNSFLSDLKKRINSAQIKAALAVNQELILLYWRMGLDILEREQTEGWGSKVIRRLSKDLKREFPDMRGFSPRNLQYMRALAEAYPDETIVLQVIAQIPWGHNQSLLNKLNSRPQRLWYAQKALENGWSRSILDIQIDTDLLGRQGGADTNFERTLPPKDSDLSQQLLKDPYNFSFLKLETASQERDLERALVEHIREFLLELGVGFAFVGSQYRLEVEGSEFFIDLLFYHLKLRRYVVIDLKTTDFKPEFAGKMNFYVNAVDNMLAEAWDEPTIGIVLCKSKKKTIVEYALNSISTPIGVSTYKLRESLPPELRDCLPTAEQLQAELEVAAKEVTAQTDETTP